MNFEFIYDNFGQRDYLSGWPSGLRRQASNLTIQGSNPAPTISWIINILQFLLKNPIFNSQFTPLRT